MRTQSQLEPENLAMKITILPAALILAAVLWNGGAAQIMGFPEAPFSFDDPTSQLRDFPRVPFSMGDVPGFGMPDWSSGSWIPGFNGGLSFPGGVGGVAGAMGTWKPWIVCSERGPCFRKKLTCPKKCFSFRSLRSKGFAGGASGGGCFFDCKRRCTAIC